MFSSAHVLGEAMERVYGGHLCYGPPIEQGFYYDMYSDEYKVSGVGFFLLGHNSALVVATGNLVCFQQCWGSGTGSACFWASRIRILIRLWIRILLFSHNGIVWTEIGNACKIKFEHQILAK